VLCWIRNSYHSMSYLGCRHEINSVLRFFSLSYFFVIPNPKPSPLTTSTHFSDLSFSFLTVFHLRKFFYKLSIPSFWWEKFLSFNQMNHLFFLSCLCYSVDPLSVIVRGKEARVGHEWREKNARCLNLGQRYLCLWWGVLGRANKTYHSMSYSRSGLLTLTSLNK